MAAGCCRRSCRCRWQPGLVCPNAETAPPPPPPPRASRQASAPQCPATCPPPSACRLRRRSWAPATTRSTCPSRWATDAAGAPPLGRCSASAGTGVLPAQQRSLPTAPLPLPPPSLVHAGPGRVPEGHGAAAVWRGQLRGGGRPGGNHPGDRTSTAGDPPAWGGCAHGSSCRRRSSEAARGGTAGVVLGRRIG